MGLWITLLRVNEGGKLDTVSNEEYRSIVALEAIVSMGDS